MTTDHDPRDGIDVRVRSAFQALDVPVRSIGSVSARSQHLADRHRRRLAGSLVASSVVIVGSLLGVRVMRDTGGTNVESVAGTLPTRTPGGPGAPGDPGSASSVGAIDGSGVAVEDNPTTVPAGWEQFGVGPRIQAVRADDGVAIVVAFVGSPGSNGVPLGVCEEGYRASVVETDHDVTVRLVAYRRAGVGEVACIAVGAQRSLRVELASPLGDRLVRDSNGDDVPASTTARFKAEWLPEGWHLVDEHGGPSGSWTQAYGPSTLLKGSSAVDLVSVTRGGRALLDGFVGGDTVDQLVVASRPAAFLRSAYDGGPVALVIGGASDVVVLNGVDRGILVQIAAGLAPLPAVSTESVVAPPAPAGSVTELKDREGSAVVTGYLVLPSPGGPGTMCDVVEAQAGPLNAAHPSRCVGDAVPIEWNPPLAPPAGLTSEGGVASGKVTIAVQRKGGRFFVLPRSSELADPSATPPTSAAPTPPTT